MHLKVFFLFENLHFMRLLHYISEENIVLHLKLLLFIFFLQLPMKPPLHLNSFATFKQTLSHLRHKNHFLCRRFSECSLFLQDSHSDPNKTAPDCIFPTKWEANNHSFKHHTHAVYQKVIKVDKPVLLFGFKWIYMLSGVTTSTFSTQFVWACRPYLTQFLCNR